MTMMRQIDGGRSRKEYRLQMLLFALEEDLHTEVQIRAWRRARKAYVGAANITRTPLYIQMYTSNLNYYSKDQSLQ